MTYEETMAYIRQMNRFGSVLGLSRIEMLLNKLHNPQNDLKVIHVSGTNGKGSVCTMIASILACGGYQVGRYISPTLYDYRERIQINGAFIPEEKVCEYMTKIRAVCEEMAEEGMEHPTIFEAETAMSFLYFKEMACDFVVLEVGLGGREDSTNVIEKPVLSVITSISMDHMQVLGDTLEAIAWQKAGIIKAGCPVVSYTQQPEAAKVIEKECINLGAVLTCVDKEAVYIEESRLGSQVFSYKGYKDLEIGLDGTYQVQNAAVAIEVFEVLKSLGYHVDEQILREGLLHAVWHGRFEVVHKDPLVIVDGAHNQDAAKVLASSVVHYFEGKRLIYVTGVFKDKDYDSILKIMSPYAKTLVAFKPETDRGLAGELLQDAAKPYYEETYAVADAATAIAKAMELADAQDVILCFGSLSTISEITYFCQQN